MDNQTSKNGMNRRDFLKAGGMRDASLFSWLVYFIIRVVLSN